MFRSKPIRMVLPLKIPQGVDGTKPGKLENLVKLPNTKAEAYLLPNKNVFLKPEPLTKLGCETPRINYEKHLGKRNLILD